MWRGGGRERGITSLSFVTVFQLEKYWKAERRFFFHTFLIFRMVP